MVVKTNNNRIGDLIKWEIRREFCRIGVTINRIAAGPSPLLIPNPMGYPVVDNGDGTATLAHNTVTTTNEDDVNALWIKDEDVSLLTATTILNQVILRRGPAIINENMLPADDYIGVAFSAGVLKTGLLAENIITVAEPAAAVTDEQVT